MKIARFTLAAFCAFGALLSAFDTLAESYEYPLYTYKFTDPKHKNGSFQREEGLRNYTYRKRLAEARKTNSFSSTYDAKLALKFHNRLKISNFEELQIRTINPLMKNKNIDLPPIYQETRHSIELPNIYGYDSLLLYYKNPNPLYACRPQMHIDSQGTATKSNAPAHIETYTGIYKSISNIPIYTETAKIKNISYYAEKYLVDQGKREWWMTRKENLTVFQRTETIKLFGKSRMIISSIDEIQQVNFRVTIAGKGKYLLEYTDIKKDVQNGRNIISIDLHEKIGAINPKLITDGYYIMADIDGVNGVEDNLSAAGYAPAVEINEIIINVMTSDTPQSDIEIEISTDSQLNYQSSEFAKVYVPANHHQHRDGYEILEIPLQAIKKLRNNQLTTAYFNGISESRSNISCQFDVLKSVLVNYEQYKFPSIAVNNWVDETNDFLDIKQFEEAREYNNKRAIYNIENLVLQYSQKPGSDTKIGTTGFKFALLNGSLHAEGILVKRTDDDISKPLKIIGEDITAVRINSTVNLSGNANHWLLVSSSGLCGSDYYTLKLYGRDGHFRILEGKSNQGLHVTGDGNQIVGYEVEFTAPQTLKPCQSFEFNFSSVYQKVFTSDWSFLSDNLPIYGTKEAVISSIRSNIYSIGKFGTYDHLYSLSYSGDRLSIDPPADLFILESVSLTGNGIFDAKHCADIKLTFLYEWGDTLSADASRSLSDNTCYYHLTGKFSTNPNNKLLKIHIDHRIGNQNSQFKLRFDVRGVYKSPALFRAEDSIIGKVSGRNIHIGSIENSDLISHHNIKSPLLKVPLTTEAGRIISEPVEVFTLSQNPYFSVQEIVLATDDRHMFPILDKLIEASLVKSSNTKSQLFALWIVILPILFATLALLKNNSLISNYFNIQASFLTNFPLECKHCLLLSLCSIVLFIFVLVSFLHPSTDLALAFISSSVVIISYIFYLLQIDSAQPTSVDEQLAETLKFRFILSILYINSTHFFFIALLGLEYRPASLLLVAASSIVCSILVYIPIGIKRRIAELGELNILFIFLFLGSILVLSYFSKSSQAWLSFVFCGACLIFLLLNRILSPLANFYITSSMWLISCVSSLFSIIPIVDIASIITYAALTSMAITLTYDFIKKNNNSLAD